jgi:hypothetical protein
MIRVTGMRGNGALYELHEEFNLVKGRRGGLITAGHW